MIKLKQIIVCVAIVLVLTSCGKKNQTMLVPDLVEPVGTVNEVAFVEIGDISDSQMYIAQVIPQVVEQSFHESGVVEKISVSLGQQVKKGEILAYLQGAVDGDAYTGIMEEINSTEKRNEEVNLTAQYDLTILKMKLEQLQSSLKEVENDAKADIRQQIKVMKVDIKIAKQEIVNELENQSIIMEELLRQKQSIERTVDKYYLYAEMDGVVSCISLNEGDYVSEGEFFIVISNEEKKLIKSEFINKKRFRDADRYYAMCGEKKIKIEQCEYDIEAVKGLFEEGYEVPSYYNIMDKDFSCEIAEDITIHIETGCVSDALILPINAVFSESNQYYVYKKVDESRKKTVVTVGTQNMTHIQIVEGLEEGDCVYVQ